MTIYFPRSWSHKQISELKKNVAILNCWTHRARGIWDPLESQGLSKALGKSPYRRQNMGQPGSCWVLSLWRPACDKEETNVLHSKWSSLGSSDLKVLKTDRTIVSLGDTWQGVEIFLVLITWEAGVADILWVDIRDDALCPEEPRTPPRNPSPPRCHNCWGHSCCLSTRDSIYLPIHPSNYPNVYPSNLISIIYLSICHLPAYLYTYLTIHPSLYT